MEGTTPWYKSGWVWAVLAVAIVALWYGWGWYHTRISPYTPQASTYNCPDGEPIKGNAQSGIYHLPSGQYYSKTKPERCFSTEEDAISAGYRASKR